MATKVKYFKATKDGLSVMINTADIADIVDVQFTLADNTIVPREDMTELTVGPDPDPDYPGTNFQFDYPMDASDGVYSVHIELATGVLDYVIGNVLSATLCLIRKTLKDEVACLLMQQIEATKQSLMLGDDVSARAAYSNTAYSCTDCLGGDFSTDIPLSGISVWIINDTFIVQ